MPSGLVDRPVLSSPQPEAPRRRRSTAVLVSAVLVAGLAVVGADRALDALPGIGVPELTRDVDRSRPALMTALSDLDDFSAARGSYQVVVDLEQDVRYVPSWVKGERTRYLAVGSVDALVDFGELGASGVQTEGQSVVITLPAPRLDAARLDLDKSEVLDRDRGVIDRVGGVFSDDPTSEREVALLAEDKLTAAATGSDVLRRAEDSTRTMLEGLARSFGYDDVTVRFEDAPGV